VGNILIDGPSIFFYALSGKSSMGIRVLYAHAPSPRDCDAKELAMFIIIKGWGLQKRLEGTRTSSESWDLSGML
jgi:hypothetical protein